MARRRSREAQPPPDLYDYLSPDPVRRSASSQLASEAIAVTDNWPDFVPVTDHEARIIEAFFADVLDELFGPIP